MGDRRRPRCTGLSASWCPVHGSCSCPAPSEAMDDGACPLHRPDGPHPLPVPELFTRRRPNTTLHIGR